MRATREIPDDPTLPALAAIRAVGLARAIPALGLDEGPLELTLCGYTPGQRAAIEVRAGRRRFAVKAYSSDPASEVALYQALAAAGLAGDSGVRVPALLAWDRDLRVEVIGWLDGPTAQQLIKNGQGARAGELAAGWLQRAASLAVKIGPLLGTAHMLELSRKWVAKLSAAAPALGTTATALGGLLARTQPKECAPRLVHGSLYARHVLDLGDGPGLIDWDCFGQGPLEFDAAMFLASVWRMKLQHEFRSGEVTRAEQALVTGTAGLLDERTLAWHRAMALLHLAERSCKPTPRRQGDGVARAQAQLDEAVRLAKAAG